MTLFDLEAATEWPTRKAAVLSEDGLYRYELIRTWCDPGAFLQRLLTFIMLNPSDADAEKNDPTVLRFCGFARRLGYDGARALNLSAYRTPYPDALHAARAAGVDVNGPENDEWLRRTLRRARNEGAAVICAWGNGAYPERVEWLTAEASALGVQLAALGVTNSGAPKHPLARGRSRIPDDAQPQPWPAADHPALDAARES